MRIIIRLFLVITIILGLGLIFYFYADLSNWRQIIRTQSERGILRQLRLTEPKIIISSPLRGPTRQIESNLTVIGTIKETNIQRTENGLAELTPNEQLNEMARLKVADMFDRQYFEHQSPTGEGPADLAETVGYKYLLVGENLALGNYQNDQALVEAWMNSPGHRENILNRRYTEIGVATQYGLFEGQMVWLAVQEFGRPASLCPGPSQALKNQIEDNQNLLENYSDQLATERVEISAIRPKRGIEYEEKISAYNDLVNQYNKLIEETKKMTAVYNDQVKIFNQCLE